MPSLASRLQMRLAAGESFPRVKPCAKTPQPRTAASGRSFRPASIGPLVLANDTRSAMSHMVSKPGAAPRSQPTPRTSAFRHVRRTETNVIAANPVDVVAGFPRTSRGAQSASWGL
jgi:hypothetical protein